MKHATMPLLGGSFIVKSGATEAPSSAKTVACKIMEKFDKQWSEVIMSVLMSLVLCLAVANYVLS